MDLTPLSPTERAVFRSRERAALRAARKQEWPQNIIDCLLWKSRLISMLRNRSENATAMLLENSFRKIERAALLGQTPPPATAAVLRLFECISKNAA
jgi:hypothetical protein